MLQVLETYTKSHLLKKKKIKNDSELPTFPIHLIIKCHRSTRQVKSARTSIWSTLTLLAKCNYPVVAAKIFLLVMPV